LPLGGEAVLLFPNEALGVDVTKDVAKTQSLTLTDFEYRRSRRVKITPIDGYVSENFNDAWQPTTSPTSQTNEMHIIHNSIIDHTFLSIKTPPLHQDLWIRFPAAFIISQRKTDVNSTPKNHPAKPYGFVGPR
jgi:hypothetical protein